MNGPDKLECLSQQFIFFVIYEWTKYARVFVTKLYYIRNL